MERAITRNLRVSKHSRRMMYELGRRANIIPTKAMRETMNKVVNDVIMLEVEKIRSEMRIDLLGVSPIKGIKRMIEMVHHEGSKIILQINHGGGRVMSQLKDTRSFGPSSLEIKDYSCREMTVRVVRPGANCSGELSALCPHRACSRTSRRVRACR